MDFNDLNRNLKCNLKSSLFSVVTKQESMSIEFVWPISIVEISIMAMYQ